MPRPRPTDPAGWIAARVIHDGECWIWQGRARSGRAKTYGVMHFASRIKAAHRYVYELLVGPVPEGLVLDHLCRRPLCVNPAHLEPVTQGENVRRGSSAQRTHCVHGHLYDEANTRWYRGHRHCRTCQRERVARNYWADIEKGRARKRETERRRRARVKAA